MRELDPAFITAAALAALLVGLGKGGLTMVGVLGTPILALAISPVQAAALLLPIYIASDLVGLWSYRREFDRRNLTILLPAAVGGILLGWATASRIDERKVGLMIGLIGIGFCINA